MLLETKAKVAWIIDGKVKKRTETYILDADIFAQAELVVMTELTKYKNEGTVDSFDILSIKASPIKEIASQYQGESSYIAALRDTIILEDDTEKPIKYKILLWADNISEAMAHTREIASQGYDMSIDGLKEVSYTYLHYDGTAATED